MLDGRPIAGTRCLVLDALMANGNSDEQVDVNLRPWQSAEKQRQRITQTKTRKKVQTNIN